MLRDPIVEETRRAGEKLAQEANYDMRRFFSQLRAVQERYKDRLCEVTPVIASQPPNKT
jgi:hypothetical protein